MCVSNNIILPRLHLGVSYNVGKTTINIINHPTGITFFIGGINMYEPFPRGLFFIVLPPNISINIDYILQEITVKSNTHYIHLDYLLKDPPPLKKMNKSQRSGFAVGKI